MAAMERDTAPVESRGEQCCGASFVGMSGKKAKRSLAAPADVSTHSANSWVGSFALDSRLPGRNTKNHPDGEQCTAVT
jgi:hypothetical protein